MNEKVRVAGYIKLAKLWERSKESAIPYHKLYYQTMFENVPNCELYDVYIDITGKKETSKRKELVRLIRDCQLNRIDIICTPTKAYLAANTAEFCYLIKTLFSMQHRIDIITEDEEYNINTVRNEDNQREALYKMADDFIYLNPPDYTRWINDLTISLSELEKEY